MSSIQDQAALAANAAPAAVSNSEAAAQAFLDKCAEWGEKAGAGDASKVGMILDWARSAWDDNSPVGPSLKPYADKNSFAFRGYEAWRQARADKAVGSKKFKDDAKSRENRVSELNKYLKVGALPHIKDTDMGGYGVLKRAQSIIGEREDIKGEVEDLLSKVATAQLRSPQVPLTDDDIVEAMTATKGNKVELTADEAEAKRWASVIVQIDAIREKFGHVNDPDAIAARDHVSARIHTLGGTREDKLRAAKQAEKDAAKLNGKAKGTRRGKRK